MGWSWRYLILLTSVLAQNESYTKETIQPGGIEHYLEFYIVRASLDSTSTPLLLLSMNLSIQTNYSG
ncbi:unnamed protein product [Bursaphelenchus okinawaensis]|uniref:Uncharacterized protein n=1 Tax=Bursaphelenchus okinawaensis TaxID=465554 RepID=A0A811JQ94_9BILA|nr:unnamed protein product [Bursaphelenchus okinawaensis]CAG9077584.1 unnamed protein product [Bursaphelenchus okinawaensis]